MQVQAEVDVAIAMRPIKSIRANPNVKAVILLTGDGDFNDMVEYIKGERVKVFVTCWSVCISRSLRALADDIFFLDHIWSDLSNSQGNILAMTNKEILL